MQREILGRVSLCLDEKNGLKVYSIIFSLPVWEEVKGIPSSHTTNFGSIGDVKA
jgi:hypothetical protein